MTDESASTVQIDDSPGDRITAAVARFGEQVVVDRCSSLLMGGNEGEEFLLIVGGRHAQGVLDGAPPLYWPEVWGARALTFVWADSCIGPRCGVRGRSPSCGQTLPSPLCIAD